MNSGMIKFSMLMKMNSNKKYKEMLSLTDSSTEKLLDY